MGRRGGEEEEEGGESHACLCVRPFGPSQQERGEGLRLLLLLTTSGPGSPAHSHKDIVSQLLPLGNAPGREEDTECVVTHVN